MTGGGKEGEKGKGVGKVSKKEGGEKGGKGGGNLLIKSVMWASAWERQETKLDSANFGIREHKSLRVFDFKRL